MKNFIVGLLVGAIGVACLFIFYIPTKNSDPSLFHFTEKADTFQQQKQHSLVDTVIPLIKITQAQTDIVNRDSLVLFAQSLLGTPYLYGSTDPAKGFDCSGFITYVFNHFKITVPRSSYDFEKIGKQKELALCQKGDLILFTGTNPQEKIIGHIGIVTENKNGIQQFIHSSSGKVNSVTITSMESVYYKSRFVSAIDILRK